MIKADKIKIIQDLQCKHATWLDKFSSAVSTGTCVDKWHDKNILISNLIRVMYRYRPFDEAVTNADSIQILLKPTNPTEVYNISISYGAINLVTFSGTGPQNLVITAVRDLINAGTATHGYYCVENSDILYLYTYDGTATYADTPTLVISESDPSTAELSVTTSPILSTGLGPILNTWNCITLAEFCSILNRVKKTLTNCNCN
jgi:hypothetical protein